MIFLYKLIYNIYILYYFYLINKNGKKWNYLRFRQRINRQINIDNISY